MSTTETTTQTGTITATQNGVETQQPVTLTIHRTTHTDGRVDCTIEVPRIASNAQTQKG
jgi:hypothetical protein